MPSRDHAQSEVREAGGLERQRVGALEQSRGPRQAHDRGGRSRKKLISYKVWLFSNMLERLL